MCCSVACCLFVLIVDCPSSRLVLVVADVNGDVLLVLVVLLSPGPVVLASCVRLLSVSLLWQYKAV